MSVINSQPLIGASGNQGAAYNIERSLRFRSSASAYLNRTPSSTTNRQTMTFSFWIKRGTLGTTQNIYNATDNLTASSYFYFNTSNVLLYTDQVNSTQITTTQVFRDPSSWYHFVFAIDTTQATAANRVKLYVNGVQITSFSTATYPAQNSNTGFNFSSFQNNISSYWTGSGDFFDGYITEYHFIDGQQLTPSSFGETDTITGVWKPKRYAGTYGTNGFYLKFNNLTSTSTLGNDSSGNGNTWTVNNVSLTAGATYDSMTDVPTLTSATAANYCTWNPIGNGGGSISNGNLRSSTSSVTPDVGTFAMTTGKWYWETTVTTSSNPRVGIYDIGSSAPSNLGANANGWAIINSPSRLYFNGSTTNYGSFNGSNGDVVMIAYDADAGRLWFGANGSWFASGNPATAANPSVTSVTGKAIVPAVASGTGSNVFDLNCGQQPFAYTPPSGFVALNTFNLPTSTIVAGNQFMDATTYTSTGTTQTVTNSGSMQPDFLWQKSRSNTQDHYLFDSVRGAANILESNTTDAEYSASQFLTSFNSNGFTFGTSNLPNGWSNVAWQWKAGGTGVTNTAGSITSTVSVNTSAGFSIVTCTTPASGTFTVGHGLGVAPSFVITKGRTTAGYTWNVYHRSAGAGGLLVLNSTAAFSSNTGVWQNTDPTSTIIYGNSSNWGGNEPYVLYCWAEIAGFSRFGSYTGNGSTDGPFVYTGFRPKYLMVKRTDSTSFWLVLDSARNTSNAVNLDLFPNLSLEEQTNTRCDFLSNGFKIRETSAGTNASGGTYIYAAFAENPFKNSLAR